MKFAFSIFIFTAAAFLLMPVAAFAANDLALLESNVTFSKNPPFLEGQTIRIYATIENNGDTDAKGVTKFFLSRAGEQISGDQPVSVIAHGTDAVFVDVILPTGTHELFITVELFGDIDNNPSNNTVTKTVTVMPDADRDGKPNETDTDDDNDGVPDTEDAFPLDRKESVDTDGDTKGDNKDEDDDNDGMPDAEDAMPLDANETLDTDHDGIGNNADSDDDNDGISDKEEVLKGLNPLSSDSDGDGAPDGADAFPLDPKESGDFDDDGIGNNADTDADNDGIIKSADTNDTNAGPVVKINRLPLFIETNKPITINPGDTYDPDGSISRISLSIVRLPSDGALEPSDLMTNIVLPKPTLIQTFTKPGRYKITIRAVDNNNETREKTIAIAVRTPLFYRIWGLIVIMLIAATFVLWSLRKKAYAQLPISQHRTVARRGRKKTHRS